MPNRTIERPLQPPDNGLECSPDSNACNDCESWTRDDCMKIAHEDRKCWYECKYCEQERLKVDCED
jgi:hypothetical protein